MGSCTCLRMNARLKFKFSSAGWPAWSAIARIGDAGIGIHKQWIVLCLCNESRRNHFKRSHNIIFVCGLPSLALLSYSLATA